MVAISKLRAKLTLEKNAPGALFVGKWVGLGAGLDDLKDRKICYPAGNQTTIPRSPSM
jgi:hypothetical protein